MAEKTVAVPVEEKAPVVQEKTRAEDRYVVPPVDIYEDKEGLNVVADLPGVTSGSLDIRVDQGILTIEGRTTHNSPPNQVYREYRLASFFRQFQMPARVAVEGISAKLQNGVLTLRIPWAPEVKPRKIEITAS